MLSYTNQVYGQLHIIGASPFQDSIWSIDSTVLQVKQRASPDLPGFTITGMNSITFDPTTGNYYCIAKVSGVTGRILGILNIHDWTVTEIGNLGDNFSSLTVRTTDGQLFGVTGNGASVPETLYTIDKTNANKTLAVALGNGTDGEIICYNPDDNMIYHWSGNTTMVFEKFPATAPYTSITNIPVSGTSNGETFGVAYMGNNKFLVSNINSQFKHLNTSGVYGNSLMSLPDDLRGIVFTRLGFNNNSLNGITACAGSSITIPYTNLSFLSGNKFYFDISDIGGSFTTYTTMDSVTLDTQNDGANITVKIPSTLSAGSYKLRIRSSSPIMMSPDWGNPSINVIEGSTTTGISITGTINDSITVCANTNVVLNPVSSGGTMLEYLWYKNGVPANYINGGAGLFTVNSGTTAHTDVYSLKVYYTGEQCFSFVSDSVYVITSVPDVTITPSGATTFCANNPTTLQAIAGMNNYLWKRSTLIVQSGVNPNYIPTASGNHSVTITDANNCSKTSTWTNVSINPIPTANAGADKSICLGTSTIIGSTNNVNNTYVWSPTTGLSNAAISNPTTSTINTETYTVTVTNNITNCSNTDNITVSVLALPATPSLSSTATEACQGSNIVLTPSSTSATSINWYKNGVLLFNKPTTFLHTVTAATSIPDIYTIKSKNSSGCLSSASNTLNILIKEAAIPTTSSVPAAIGSTINVCVPGGTNGSATLTASSTTISPSYSWLVGGVFVPGATNNTYTQNVSTTSNNKVVSVMATYPNGCSRISSSKTVKLITLGCTPKLASEKEGDSNILLTDNQFFTIYPNPSNDVLNVKINHSNLFYGKVMLYNTLGQVVLYKEVELVNGIADLSLSIQTLANGIYTFVFEAEGIYQTEKIVKE